jgi:hypothetical protein
MKTKDGALVTFPDEQGESMLCWACLKKMANRKMRLAESKGAVPAAAQPKPQGNGAPAAVAVK